MKRRIWTKIRMKEVDGLPFVDWENSEWKVINHFENLPGVTYVKGGGGGTQTSTTTSEPPAFIQPYLGEAASQAEQLYQTPGTPGYYPGETVVPFSPETEQALSMITDRATAGSPLTAAASGQLEKTLGGEYLAEGNPMLQAAIDQASEGVIRNYQNVLNPAIQSSFAQGGRYGSGIFKDVSQEAQEMTGDQLRKIATDMAYQGYGDERQRQLAATALTPQITAQDYADAQALTAVGSTRENLQQAQLQEAIDRFTYGENLDQAKLNQYISQLSQLGGFGGTTTTTGTGATGGGFGSSILGGLGGAASGVGLASSLGSMGVLGSAALGPAGIGLGILGGLGGMFG